MVQVLTQATKLKARFRRRTLKSWIRCTGLFHKETDQELLIKANVLGMLNAQEKMTGHVNMANYQGLYDQLIVKEV